MKPDQKKRTTGDILLQVRSATHQIQAARKQAVSEYDADLRRLDELDKKLTTPEAVAQPELFAIDEMLTPETEELLRAPLAKYN
jgi:hypothetical protein